MRVGVRVLSSEVFLVDSYVSVAVERLRWDQGPIQADASYKRKVYDDVVDTRRSRRTLNFVSVFSFSLSFGSVT